jgi:uncharacterized YigZ family protein
MDKYFSIQGFKREQIKIKGSKFIASVENTDSKDKAEEFLQRIKSEFYDATHNCFAYVTGYDKLDFRYSDDGEPSNSAGKPIYQAIEKSGYTDICVVVTRYFGGTKLGVGGLIRAYSGAAEEVLKITDKKVLHRTKIIDVQCSYEEISALKRLIGEYAVSFEEKYTDKVNFHIAVHLSDVESFIAETFDSTLGKAEIKENDYINIIEKK